MPVLRTWSKDKRVKFWLKNHDTPEPEVDRSKVVGFFLPVLDSIKLIEGMYNSFLRSMPLNYPFALIVMDGGSTDGTLEYFQANCVTYSNKITSKEIIPENITGLCRGTDEVATRLLKDDFGYIGYLHADMEFTTDGWAGKLVEVCESDHQIGILGPRTEQNKTMEKEMKFANVSPWIAPVRVVEDHIKHFGFMFDPGLYFQVAYCDWDLHMRNMFVLRYKSMICRDIHVSHPMCGTRPDLHKADPRRDLAVNANRDYWCKKWGLDFIDDPFKLLQSGRYKIERTV